MQVPGGARTFVLGKVADELLHAFLSDSVLKIGSCGGHLLGSHLAIMVPAHGVQII
jgi:hypothetical protein